MVLLHRPKALNALNLAMVRHLLPLYEVRHFVEATNLLAYLLIQFKSIISFISYF